MATVICPNCGGENNITNKDGQECAYCGTILHLPTPKESKTRGNASDKKSKELSAAKFIVPIPSQYSTQEAIDKALKTYLTVQDDVPADIFDHLELKTVKWLYLPMWRYNGNISTEWSCDQVVYRKRRVEERPIHDSKGNFVRMESIYETYEDYLPKSGHGQTSFDILVPAIKKIKEELPYFSIDFNEIKEYSIERMGAEAHLSPISASIRKASNDVNSEFVLTEVATDLKHRAEKCSYGNLVPRSSSYLPRILVEGRECVNEHLSFNYRFNENGTVGELYYIPFVHVTYSYKGDTFDWGFVLKPDNANDSYDRPTDTDSSIEDGINIQKGNANQLSAKWNSFIFVSGVLSFVIGMIIFLVRNLSLYERIGERYQHQESMYSLLGIYKRRNSLLKHGVDKKALADIEEKIKDEYGDEEDWDNEDDKTPKNIEEIHQYFSETEVLKQKLLKRMKRFWIWYISLIVVVGGSILGYNIYNNIQKEERLREEIAIIEREKQQLCDAITQKFNAEFIGNVYEGSTLSSYNESQMKIKFLTKSKLQYQIGVGSGEYDGWRQKIKWEQPKTVEYKLVIESVKQHYGGETTTICSIMFDGYTTENILEKYGNNEFRDEIIIPLKGSSTYSVENYHLKKK